MEMPTIFLALDPYLIWFFRLTGQAWLNYLLGNLAMACLAWLAGEITSALASFMVRRRYTEVAGEARKYQDLSMDALKAGDKPSYEAANELANEAFGKSFFMQMALSATFFWPIFLVLGWMQFRFFDLDFPIPFTGFSLGYIGIFILVYIPVYILFNRLTGRVAAIGGYLASLTKYFSQEGTSKPFWVKRPGITR